MPDFFIVGAAKSGTTSLYEMLTRHPGVFMPDIKEPHFMVANQVKGKIPTCVDNIGDYSSLYANAGERVTGEASVLYLYYYQEAIRNIKKHCGDDVKIIIMLRNPVARAYSAYLYAKMYDANETLDFMLALKAEDERIEKGANPMLYYKSLSMYSNMVSAYKNAFENVKVIILDDFVKSPDAVYKDLCGFLGLVDVENITNATKSNEGGRVWKNKKFGEILRNVTPNWLRTVLKLFLGNYYWRLKSYVVSRFMEKAPKMSEDESNWLCNYFTNDVMKLSKVIGRNDVLNWVRR